VGYRRGGLPGLLVAGSCFIIPPCLIVVGIAWAYVRYGNAPQVEWLMYGVSPVIIAIVAQALWKLGASAVKGPATALIGMGAIGLALAGFNELALLALAAIVMLVLRLGRPGILTGALVALSAGTVLAQTTSAVDVPFTLTRLTLFFLKVGAILFGSGYVLLAFLRADLTDRWGWLTDQQLIDAVTVGQVTPGPVFTTATFIGYLLGGGIGATLATVAIFAPGFLFVAVSQPLIPRLRASPITGALLDGVVVASLGLMAMVTWHLARSAIVDVTTAGLAVVATAILLTLRPNSAWLVLSGAVVGWMLQGGI
jgi:chromate transporter